MEMFRINTRVSMEMNEWLDAESERTGISKSSLVMVALEQYKLQKTAITTLDMVVRKLEDLESKLEK